MSYKKYNNFETFTAADANILMRQGMIVVANATERDAIDSPTEGMQVYRLDTQIIERHDGTSWDALDSGWVTVPSFTNGFTAVSAEAPRYRRIGKTVFVQGQVFNASAMTSTPLGVFTLPAGFRPSRREWQSSIQVWQAVVEVNTSGVVLLTGNTTRNTGTGWPITINFAVG
jgi:hypothetical protein